jgi:Ca2+-binding RTX toxin-like protein
VLRGRGGADALYGGSSSDRIRGGRGNDRLVGRRGADLLLARDNAWDAINCGSGRDTVVADRGDQVSRNCERVRRG